jgi:hypothetical protein
LLLRSPDKESCPVSLAVFVRRLPLRHRKNRVKSRSSGRHLRERR